MNIKHKLVLGGFDNDIAASMTKDKDLKETIINNKSKKKTNGTISIESLQVTNRGHSGFNKRK